MTVATMPKPHADRPIEGMMAKWYASNTGEMMGEYIELAERIARELEPGSTVLEVAPGPGFFAIELAKRGAYEITGLDLSRTFVRLASGRAEREGVRVKFEHGSASNMPFLAASFDFLLCRAAFKNFAKPVDALREMHRVLKPGGRGLIIDLKRDASREGIDEHVNGMGLTRFNSWLTKTIFHTMLIRSAYTAEEIREMLWEANFRDARVDENGIGMEIWLTR